MSVGGLLNALAQIGNLVIEVPLQLCTLLVAFSTDLMVDKGEGEDC